MNVRSYTHDAKKFGAGLNFFSFQDDQTIPIPFGKMAADRFWTLLRRVGEMVEFEITDDGVITTKKNFFR